MITFNELGKYGRFGNQLFQIAGTIGLAEKHGYDYGFPKWINHDHKDRFSSPEDINIYDYFINQLPEVESGEYDQYYIPWGFHDIIINDFVSLHGHMQSEKYFKHCRDKILHFFRMKDLDPFTPDPGSIAIHIRLGDYDGDYHPRLGMEYYGKALEKFSSWNKIYIFSDDITAARKLFGSTCEYVEGNHYMIDFYIMRKCKHFIIGNSTYSWWAAWLSEDPESRVIMPCKWFGPAAKITGEDLICEGWEVV